MPLLTPHSHATAILENAADRGGDLDLLAGSSIYCDVRFTLTEADMAEWARSKRGARTQTRAVAVNRNAPTGRPWTDADHAEFRAASEAWDAANPA